jgi:hypothetical protein
MKRAALIVTDANTVRVALYDDAIAAVTGDAEPLEVFVYAPDSQLLADLREAASACALVAATSSGPRAQYWDDLAARVRALLPEEEAEDE